MKFRGPKALSNRRQKTIVCPTHFLEASQTDLTFAARVAAE